MRRQRNPFARTRVDHQAEIAEDYVELIYRLEEREQPVRVVDLVRALEVAQPTVTKALERLSREELIELTPRQPIVLTAKGRELAERSVARHDLLVAFLRSIGVSELQAELDAEGMEHHLSTETLAAMERIVQSGSTAK